MIELAQTLTRETDRPVVDRTGLSGEYAFELQWTPDGGAIQSDSLFPSLFTAVQEQLGLKLEPQTAEVEALVIDARKDPLRSSERPHTTEPRSFCRGGL
jgi:uncharacterized protein (TIGR03435 family)